MLYFLKLGGSLITHKDRKSTCRLTILKRLAAEIAQAYNKFDFSLLIGHGSGSFGHIPAKFFNTRNGVNNKNEWMGFVEVWNAARQLDQLVISAFYEVGLPIMAFPPSSAVISEGRKISVWDISAINCALSKKIIPLIQGDVVFDLKLGGTILSTEELFSYLSFPLKPDKIFLAGNEEGVWRDFPSRKILMTSISTKTISESPEFIFGSDNPDVTGGMLAKVKNMVELVHQIPGLKGYIFSGIRENSVFEALSGNDPGGTIIHDEFD